MKTRIVVDVSSTFLSQTNTGIQRVVRQLSMNFASSSSFDVVFISTTSRKAGVWALITPEELHLIEHSNKSVQFLNRWLNKFNEVLNNRQHLKFYNLLYFVRLTPFASYIVSFFKIGPKRLNLMKRNRYVYRDGDVYFTADSFWNCPMSVDLIKKFSRKKLKIFIFVHDIFPITHPEWFSKLSLTVYQENFSEIVRMADQLFVPSEFVRNELLNFSARIVPCQVVKLTGNSFSHLNIVPKSKGRRCIMIGTIEPRKDYMEALTFFEQLGQGFTLVIVGKKGWLSEEIIKKVSQCESKGFLEWKHNLSDDELAREIENSSIGLCTSKAEGFGLPVSELLENRLPVVAASISVFQEMQSENLYFYEKGDFESFRIAIETASTVGYLEEFIEPRTWRAVAEEITSTIS